MQNYNTQQQAVILKGIASQILSMNVPTFEEVGKLIHQFDIHLGNSDSKRPSESLVYEYQEISKCILLLLMYLPSERSKRINGANYEEKIHTVLHTVLSNDTDNMSVLLQKLIVKSTKTLI